MRRAVQRDVWRASPDLSPSRLAGRPAAPRMRATSRRLARAEVAAVRPAWPRSPMWTGDTLLVIGGDTEPCHPARVLEVRRRCTRSRTARRTTPDTDTWRRIADAPVGIDFAHAAVDGRPAVRLDVRLFRTARDADGVPRLRPRVRRWLGSRSRRAMTPTSSKGSCAACGPSRIVWTTDSDGDAPAGARLRPRVRARGRRCRGTPRPGMSRVLDGGRRLSFSCYDHKVVPTLGVRHPARVAEYRFDTNRWRRLPDVLDYPSGAYTLEGGSSFPCRGALPLHPSWHANGTHVENPPPGQEDFGGGAYATALWTEDEGDLVPLFRLGLGRHQGCVDRRAAPSRGRPRGRRAPLRLGRAARSSPSAAATWSGIRTRSCRNDTWTWSPDDEPTPALITVD